MEARRSQFLYFSCAFFFVFYEHPSLREDGCTTTTISGENIVSIQRNPCRMFTTISKENKHSYFDVLVSPADETFNFKK